MSRPFYNILCTEVDDVRAMPEKEKAELIVPLKIV